ncbi:uncharacterized protein LOC141883987 [Acropora palmata]|uniref:uncharacterized protein LOC141883987 n=1 Tax=Acropora palmata TaxID=6131 RepID=UPI003D9FDD2C
MSIGLKEVITVLPLQKPREKPWLRDNLEGQKTDSIREVLEKFKEVVDRQSVASARLKKLDKIETDERTATCGLRGFPRESPGLIRALEVYSPNNPATAKWRSGLRPLSIYQQNQLQKAVRDYTKLYSVQHTPPQTTLSVRWRNHGTVTCYSRESLLKIFSHFGPVRKISFQSECSAHVVLENVESACAALSLSNLGFPSSPLHVRWLAEERKMLVWRRKDAVANPLSNSERKKTGRKGPNKTIMSKGRRFKSP